MRLSRPEMRRAAYSADSLSPITMLLSDDRTAAFFYRRCPEKSGIYPHHMVVSRDMPAAYEGTDIIALKESNETSYWLELMYETKRIDLASYKYAEKLCGNIRRLLIASCKTAKENPQ